MVTNRSGHRVGYDRLWGALLLLGCFLPLQGRDRDRWLWDLLSEADDAAVVVWLLLSLFAGAFALFAGFAGMRTRWRHFLNFLFGAIGLGLPLAAPVIWRKFPTANPASLPLSDLGGVGWVMLTALLAVYAGSGVRVARPSQILGQVLAGLGAFLLAMFAFLPVGRPGSGGYAPERILLLVEWSTHWKQNAAFLLTSVATSLAILNLVRSESEVLLAKLTRLLLVVALLFPVLIPFLEGQGAANPRYASIAWGALHLFAPLFLALDGCIAFLAISITRSSE